MKNENELSNALCAPQQSVEFLIEETPASGPVQEARRAYLKAVKDSTAYNKTATTRWLNAYNEELNEERLKKKVEGLGASFLCSNDEDKVKFYNKLKEEHEAEVKHLRLMETDEKYAKAYLEDEKKREFEAKKLKKKQLEDKIDAACNDYLEDKQGSEKIRKEHLEASSEELKSLERIHNDPIEFGKIADNVLKHIKCLQKESAGETTNSLSEDWLNTAQPLKIIRHKVEPVIGNDAFIGFESYRDAEQFAKKHGGRVCIFRSHQHNTVLEHLQDVNTVFDGVRVDYGKEPLILNNPNLALPPDYKIASKTTDYNKRMRDNLRLLLSSKESNLNLKQVKQLIEEYEDLIDEIESCYCDEVVITYRGKFYKKEYKNTMRFQAGDTIYVVGVLLNEKK